MGSRTMTDLGPTSPRGYAEFLDGKDLSPERVDDRTFMLSIPLPSAAIVTSTLCYVLLGEDGVGHVVDPAGTPTTISSGCGRP